MLHTRITLICDWDECNTSIAVDFNEQYNHIKESKKALYETAFKLGWKKYANSYYCPNCVPLANDFLKEL